MTKKLSVRVICLLIAGVILSGAITVAAVNGSPYEVLKRAIFNTAAYENFTLQGEFTVLFDGEVEEQTTIHMVETENGSLQFHDFDFGDGRNSFDLTYGNLRLSPLRFADTTVDWYRATVTSDDWWSSSRWLMFGGMGMFPDTQGTAQFRFFEALVDLMVGDLRNQMNMHTENGIRHISGAISHSQLPEIIQAAIDMGIEEGVSRHERAVERGHGSREDYWNPVSIPVRSINFDRIEGSAQVDAAGNLLYISGNINVSTENVFGDHSNIEMTFELRFSDIGTTVLESPIPGAVELFTGDFMDELGVDRWQDVFFTLTEDGNIDIDSITTQWPVSGGRGWESEWAWEDDFIFDERGDDWDEWLEQEIVHAEALELQMEIRERILAELELAEELGISPEYIDIDELLAELEMIEQW